MVIKKFYYSAIVFYLIMLVSYVSYQYMQDRTSLFEQIDQKLIKSAMVGDQFLPISLHTPNMRGDTLSATEDLRNRLALSKFSETMKIKYVYSCILQNGKIYFTSSSATPTELKTGEGISYYYDIYDDASPMLVKALQSRQMQFDEYVDKWGHFRSVFLPHVSPSGRVYVTGVDIDISDIDGRLHTLLMGSFIEALFYIMILLPFFIAYRFHNRSIQSELARQVDERTINLQERSDAITRLLDNANQGFLSFSTSLAVENEYSQKCLDIFGEPIEGKQIGDLLYGDVPLKKEFFEQTLHAVFEEDDPVKVEAILSLLQHEFVLHNKAIDVVYKLIGKNRFMLILTDITDKKNLEKSVEQERSRLKMIVSAISCSDEFFELLEDYENFLTHRKTLVDFSQTPLANLTEIYRAIHTYKGLFSQKDFITTPQGLHKVESHFSSLLQSATVSNETMQMMLNKINFELWLTKDLNILRDTLGNEFMEKKSTIILDETTFEWLHRKIVEMIELQPDQCHKLLELLEVIQKLKYKPVGDYFTSLPKYVESLSERLEKSLYPMEIDDKTNLRMGDEFKGFAKSLIHVIRNSIDHGIESPEERIAQEKDEYGTIRFSITENNDSLVIEIADDGRGIDTNKLKEKALLVGFKTPSELETDDAIMELIFEDYFSIKDEVNDLSGRGVGLSSVAHELQKLGGTYHVTSTVGKGTQFEFFIPKSIIKGM